MTDSMETKSRSFSQILTRFTEKSFINEDTEEQYDNVRLENVKNLPFDTELLQAFYGSNDHVILVQLSGNDNTLLPEDLEKLSLTSNTTMDNRYNSTAASTFSQFELTGSPLKCNMEDEGSFFPDDTVISIAEVTLRRKTHFRPTDVDTARLITTLYNLSCNSKIRNVALSKKMFPYPPIWVVSNGKDNGRTALLGTGCCKNGRLERTVVHCDGPFKRVSDFPKLDRLRHVSKKADKFFEAVYIVGTEAADVVDVKYLEKFSRGYVTLRVTWTPTFARSTEVFAEPPADSQCTMVVHGKSSNHLSFTHDFYQEIEKFERLINCISTNVHSNNSNGGRSGDETESLLQQRVLDLIEDFGASHKRDLCGPDTTTVLAHSETNILSHVKRKDLDFTDRLWNVLKDFASTADLVDCLRSVFDAAPQLKRSVSSKRNSTTLAEILLGKEKAPPLVERIPLQILADMGLNKLRRDFFNFFKGMNLANKDHLAFYSQDGLQPAEGLSRMRKLLAVVDSVVTASVSLSLTDQVLRNYTSFLLEHYRKSDETPEYPVQPSWIKQWFNRNPKSWTLRQSIKDSYGSTKITIHFEKDCPFEWIRSNTDNSPGFYQTTVIQLRDNFSA